MWNRETIYNYFTGKLRTFLDVVVYRLSTNIIRLVIPPTEGRLVTSCPWDNKVKKRGCVLVYDFWTPPPPLLSILYMTFQQFSKILVYIKG